MVLARTDDEVLVKVSSEVMVRPMRNRDEARRLARIRSDALANQLEEDRAMRRSALLRAATAKVNASKSAAGTTSAEAADPGSATPSSSTSQDGDPPPGPQGDTSTGPGD